MLYLREHYYYNEAQTAQAIQKHATGCMVRESNPSRGKFSSPVQTGFRALPAPYTMRTGTFPWLKRPKVGVYRPPYLGPRLKKE